MAMDVSKQAYEAVYQLIKKILGSRDEAASYAEDPQGYLAAQGVTDHDLQGLDIAQIAYQACGEADVPARAKQALQEYASGGGGGGGGVPVPPKAPVPGQSPVEHLVQHVNYVTHVSYEGDTHITQQLINQENYDYSTHVDNSSHVRVEGEVHGDVTIDTSSVTATGGGVANTGYGDVYAATGDGAVAGGHVSGVATGDGAVAAGGNVEGQVNTGTFTGVQAGGDVEGAAVGDGNTVLGDVSGNVNLGGQQTVIQDSDLQDVALGGDVTRTEVDIEAEEGSAVAFGEGASASGSDVDNTVTAWDSNVAVGGGDVGQAVDQSTSTSVDIDARDSDLTTQVGDGNTAYDVDIDLNTAPAGGGSAPPSLRDTGYEKAHDDLRAQTSGEHAMDDNPGM